MALSVLECEHCQTVLMDDFAYAAKVTIKAPGGDSVTHNRFLCPKCARKVEAVIKPSHVRPTVEFPAALEPEQPSLLAYAARHGAEDVGGAVEEYMEDHINTALAGTGITATVRVGQSDELQTEAV